MKYLPILAAFAAILPALATAQYIPPKPPALLTADLPAPDKNWVFTQTADQCLLVRNYGGGRGYAVDMAPEYPRAALIAGKNQVPLDEARDGFTVLNNAAYRSTVRFRDQGKYAEAPIAVSFVSQADVPAAAVMTFWIDGQKFLEDDLAALKATLPTAEKCRTDAAAIRIAKIAAMSAEERAKADAEAREAQYARYSKPLTDQAGAVPATLLPNQKAAPANHPATWISSNDYPSILLRKEAMASVSFIVDVGPDGRVSDCRIRLSSGYQLFDEATCRAVKRRARFTPATDVDAKPIPGTFSNVVQWLLPERSLPPLDPARVYPPLPKTAAKDWVTVADLAAGPQGPIAFTPAQTYYTVQVSQTGNVTACTTEKPFQYKKSSQIEQQRNQLIIAWDSYGCSLIKQRATFEPAKGVDYAPTTSTWHGYIRWPDPQTK
jgi:TonB family protein